MNNNNDFYELYNKLFNEVKNDLQKIKEDVKEGNSNVDILQERIGKVENNLTMLQATVTIHDKILEKMKITKEIVGKFMIPIIIWIILNSKGISNFIKIFKQQ